jgi:hypothetical protein
MIAILPFAHIGGVPIEETLGLPREQAAATIRHNALGLLRAATADHNRIANDR